MRTSTQRMLTTHTGRLRPSPEQRLAMSESGNGAVSADVVAAFLQRQSEIGLDFVDDGGVVRSSLNDFALTSLTGFEKAGDGEWFDIHAPETSDFPDFFSSAYQGRADVPRLVCTGPVSWAGESELQERLERLKAGLNGRAPEDAFIDARAPTVLAHRALNRHYANEDDYLHAVAAAVQRQFRSIVDAGFLLHVDMPLQGARYKTTDNGDSHAEIRKNLSRDIEILNFALADIPPESVRLHVCYGTSEGPHHRDPELSQIVDVVLSARPAALMVVGANGRHEHEWQVWEKVKLPDGKVLIPGVIDSTTNIIENPEAVSERIVRYAGAVGRENLIAGVDCGFAPGAGIRPEYQVSSDVMWAKLTSLVQGAALASSLLWA
ncbi:MAG TPA: hypothetical protein VH951_08205 [Dehalococcoidia bacterium]